MTASFLAPAAGMFAALALWSWSALHPVAMRLKRLSSGQGRSSTHWPGPGVLTRRMREFSARRRRTERRRAAVIELCDGIGAEISAGRSPEEAFVASVAVLPPDLATDLLGDRTAQNADLADILLHASSQPGTEGLRLLAACWRIGAERGATFAAVVDGLAATLRDEQAQRDEIRGQLAGPRATARLLFGLPALGLAMAVGFGGHPIAFLLTTIPGAVCLVLGCGLDLLGLWWTSRIATAAEQVR
jgi:tight adherence protein B